MSETGAYDDWFCEQEELTQGSLLHDFKLIDEVGGSTADAPAVGSILSDVVVLTQTCDIPKKAQTTILVAEVRRFDDLVALNSGFGTKESRATLAEGIAQAHFLLPPAAQTAGAWSVVDFRALHVVPKARIEREIGASALAVPYREHLAQSFARFMMRIGLPSTLNEFKSYKPGPGSP
ncbi:hypothetical protein [Curtobacterium flaccumfaciens]|uniref:hypothetical protein n=1 Tax=Curtobacterium flaccumfaciens TaxID=2035 RepID=UPI00217611D2|nr:hypothetical protein [Curtobacterium flaccumfaciens]MCS5493128.1 hypothetical protein [Curtobacterium flaccumfaciens pv. flaccumfaciens]